MSKYGFEEEITAVVTGGSGFIGGEAVMALSEDPMVKEIRILDIAFPDFPMSHKMKFHRTDVLDPMTLLSHSKGANLWLDNVGLLGTDNSIELGGYPKIANDVNVTGFLNQIQVAKEVDIKWFYHQTKPVFSHNYENWYTVTKKQAELTALWAQTTKEVPVTIGTYFNASGFRQHLGPVRKMFPLFTILALLDFDLAVYGDGKQLMDLIHVRDLVDASILLTINHDPNRDPAKFYDIGTGQHISVIEFSEELIKLTNSNSKIQNQPMRAGEKENTEIRASSDDLETLKNKYGWEPKFSLENIIQEYVDYWLNCDDFTYIHNCLLYFQQTGRYFSESGKIVDMNDMSVNDVADRMISKRNSKV